MNNLKDALKYFAQMLSKLRISRYVYVKSKEAPTKGVLENLLYGSLIDQKDAKSPMFSKNFELFFVEKPSDMGPHWDKEKWEKERNELRDLSLQHDAYKLLAVPSPTGRVLVIAANSIHYHSQFPTEVRISGFSQDMPRSSFQWELDAANYIHGLAARGVHYIHRPGPVRQDAGFIPYFNSRVRVSSPKILNMLSQDYLVGKQLGAQRAVHFRGNLQIITTHIELTENLGKISFYLYIEYEFKIHFS
ncbi:hypothetical protein RJ641_022792, partial [Dillenia turbinata]